MQDVQRKIGQRIRKLRHEQGWSQETFADMCRFHRSYMGAVERGEVNLTIKSLQKISKILGVSISALFRDIA
jgi:transcriptional regulator with XRE-family HTH domain